jgi:hypothetical protein
VEKSEDGQFRFVYGKATGPDLDLDRQVIDADFAPRRFRSGSKASAT